MYKDTEIIGYTHIQLWPAKRAAMRIIVISENMRHHHFGSYFLSLCEQHLKNQQCKSIHVESSSSALDFYKKNGYVEIPFNDPDGYEGGPEDIAMGKIL